jgi:carbon monoxide dehydrogenase subunit G
VARYRASIETSWTPAEAFTYLSDFSTSAEWDPGVIEAQRLGPVGEGAEFRLVAEFLGRRTALTYRVVEYEPERAVAFVGENDSVVSFDRMIFEAIPTGTRVTYDADLRLKSRLLRLADPLLGLAFNRVGDRALARLREVLAEPAPGALDAAA